MSPEQHEDPQGDIIVVIAPEGLEAVSPGGEVVADDRGEELNGVLGDTTRLRPLFSESQARLREQATDVRARVGPTVPDLSRFYRVETDDPGNRRDPLGLVRRLESIGLVEAVYFKPPHELADGPGGAAAPDAAADALPATTPDFTELQGYLGPAPGGVDARFAWSGPGGTGDGVQIIDIENAWRFSHEDLVTNQGGVLNTAPDNRGWRNHGTAVAGILGGDANPFGITGICPGATVSGISVEGEVGRSAAAIRRAADRLRLGDIILIEGHTAGPITDAQGRAALGPADTVGYIPIEFWPDDFAAIRYATGRGVIVVAAAGNGARHLDDVDDLLGPTSRQKWANPFDRAEADSGAIFVGAGAPPGGGDPDRSRLAFSNWGSCLDAQAWGKQVVTTGGVGDGEGDLQGGPYEDRWYTRSFSGTSSAAPIVAGALACVQGALRAAGAAPLSPGQARALLRVTGTPQPAAPSGQLLDRIGSRPNLRELIPRAFLFSGGEELVGGPPDCPPGGGGITIVIGGCAGGWQSDWADPRWGGPGWAESRWGGPGWGGPRWGGPRWGGPRWGGPRWGGPRWGGPGWTDPAASFGFGPDPAAVPGFEAVLPATSTGRREVRRPGFRG